MLKKDKDNEFALYVLDLMQVIGDVEAKRMFGGYGFFLGGLMFALLADQVLYFKVDSETTADFKALDLPPFTYDKKGKRMQMSYCQAPETVLEDSAQMRLWANRAYEAALRVKK